MIRSICWLQTVLLYAIVFNSKEKEKLKIIKIIIFFIKIELFKVWFNVWSYGF